MNIHALSAGEALTDYISKLSCSCAHTASAKPDFHRQSCKVSMANEVHRTGSASQKRLLSLLQLPSGF